MPKLTPFFAFLIAIILVGIYTSTLENFENIVKGIFTGVCTVIGVIVCLKFLPTIQFKIIGAIVVAVIGCSILFILGFI